MNTYLNQTKASLAMLLILGLFILSCSNDDSQEEAQLILSASATEVETEQEITFEITSNGKKITDAVIHIEGTAIEGLNHSFPEKGNYSIVAKRGNNISEPITISVFESINDIYVVGYEFNQSYQLIPKYWKNGEAIDLISENQFIPTSIYVTNDDVHVTGEGFSNNISTAVYWKNNIETTLTDGTNAKSIYISNNDIYIAGSENNIAKYWKNGEAVNLTDGKQETKAKAIFVTEKGNIYVAGDAAGSGYDRFGKYWKNGEETSLNNSGSISIEAIYVTNNDDVYLAGQEFDETKSKYVAKYWKNGKAISLTDGTHSALAKSIYVTNNNDIHVVGFETDSNFNNIARYWKNGKEITLTDGNKRSEANSIQVTEKGDVFISGFEYNNIYSVAKYWKNGNEVKLSDGKNSATSNAIFVVEKKSF